MVILISLILTVLAALVAIPVILFCVEIMAAAASSRTSRPPRSHAASRAAIAVLVPAHNESQGLADTLEAIKAQLRPKDRLLVVADNCSDDTAAIAVAAGASVTERNDTGKRGKGYALDWGLKHLRHDPPEVVVFIDADCRLASGALEELANACSATGRPVQALYLMKAPEKSQIDYCVAEFAWCVKNRVRPLGLAALNLPCQLMGTGMAFPWEVINAANLASGQIVEDLKLGLDLARAGHPALFWPSAVITSSFPVSHIGAESQRKRWEKGHLNLIAVAGPGLLYEGLVRRNLGLLALTFDLVVPPLTLLGIIVASMLVVSGGGRLLGGSSLALPISALNFLGYLAAVLVCWLKWGRDVLPVRAIPSVALYVAEKLPLYRQIISGQVGSHWIRTDRGKTEKNIG